MFMESRGCKQNPLMYPLWVFATDVLVDLFQIITFRLATLAQSVIAHFEFGAREGGSNIRLFANSIYLGFFDHEYGVCASVRRSLRRFRDEFDPCGSKGFFYLLKRRRVAGTISTDFNVIDGRHSYYEGQLPRLSPERSNLRQRGPS